MLVDKQRRVSEGTLWRKDGRGNRTHDVAIIEALEHRHAAPYDLLIPLDLLRHGLQYDLACDVPWRDLSGGGIARGIGGEHSGEVS